ncbi:death-associated protein kinase related [Phlebotomus argentipes]|uniref:death-associated protein kinase related n=1 Tax=Phlebotomus argentipes TaxID=94469 RepID=UPI002893819C|nr:death-associated protein kinase related [Phlebotomus argentipes]
MQISDGIRHVGDGWLEVTEERLQGLIVHEDINDVYDVEQTPFARGKFAAVRKAVHKKSGVSFAAKFLRRRRRAQCWAKDICHEIAVLMLCSDSEHIVKLHSVHETRSETALILELATGGELQAILDNVGELTESQARTCMREILRALQYLHKKCIAHLDLKPQNILLCGENVEDGLKLCDFGISRIVEEGGKICEILGTPDYVAPEVLQYDPLCLETDIWSVGVLAYVLLTGFSPFGGDTKQETFLNISQCSLTFPEELFEGVSAEAIDFIRSALRVKPCDRMSAAECLEHKWLKEPQPSRYLSDPATAEATEEEEEEEEEEESDDSDTSDNKENVACATNKPEMEPKILILSHHQATLFPDAPTTPKVSRKAPPDSPPSVKALVKKFQLDNQEVIDVSPKAETGGTPAAATGEDCSARCAVITCLACAGLSVSACRHHTSPTSRKAMSLDQRITC